MGECVAIVTGAGGDIGRAIVGHLATSQCAIVALDRDGNAAQAAISSLTELSTTCLAMSADVTDAVQLDAALTEVEAQLGPIGILVANAGVEGVVAPITDYPETTFDVVMAVNVKGIFLSLKYALTRMLPRGEGAIVTVGSTSSIRGRANLSGYVASKHAVLGLTRAAALETQGTRVRVNAVLPGPVRSRMLTSLDAQAAARAKTVERAGDSAHAEPGDVAKTVAFLASDDASHVNGAAWVVDAGSTVP